MVKSIYFERYKKPLIAFCLLIIGICLVNAKFQSDSWHQSYTHYTEDSQAKQNFEDFQTEYSYWDDKSQNNRNYQNFQEYIDSNLYVYQPATNMYNPLKIPAATDYESHETYITNTTNYSSILLFLVPLAGFLLFFLDTKTGFNHFLFSLPVTRKELFIKKLIYIGGPILLTVLAGQILYAVLIHNMIPAPYMNATLSQLFVSVINYFFLISTIFFVSTFIGSMVGNLAFGPLTWLVFWIFTYSFPNAISAIFETISISQNNTPSIPSNLFITTVGKTGGYLSMSLLFILLSLGFLTWGYKKNQTISLENDGNYLLNQESRWPVWIFMTSFCTFILGNTFFSPWYSYYISRSIGEIYSVWRPIGSSLLILILVGLTCYVVVFFSTIKEKFASRRKQIIHSE
ncbi:ABC transporter permease [Enterococcus sp. AZ103]|uniref:ABC transporter permease n=1 Tax=Enterococcus sp. AZ103 TaxID=2774628 RepID=UPI003F258C2F